MSPQVRAFGTGAALVEVDGPAEALSLALWLRDRVEATEVVPAARTVLVDGVPVLEVQAAVRGWTPDAPAAGGDLVEVPVRYDGPDLAAVAELVGVSEEEVVRRHTEAEHVAAFCGFAPGFSYLTGSPWEVPRRSTPRSRVEPGSVGLAGPWTGVYPTASPGGWQLVGSTDVVLWDPDRSEPALLPPGTRVRFRAVPAPSGGVA